MSDSAMFENANEGLVVDLSNVEAMKFEVLPKGIYNVIISDAKFEKSKSSGNPMWNLTLTVFDEEYKNRKLFTFMSFSEGALPGTKANMMVLKPELANKPFNPSDPELLESLIGVKCRVKVRVGKYNDNERNEVQSFLASAEASDGFMG